MAYNSGDLSEGNHTIKIRVTGSKNGAATGAYAIIDYVKVFQAGEGGGGGGELLETAASLSESIQYYPNPVRSGDVLHVSVPEATGEVSLLDLSGVQIRSMVVTDNALEVPTDGLSNGLYLLQYQTRNGREVVKIMVH
jgi:hypothetical protein